MPPPPRTRPEIGYILGLDTAPSEPEPHTRLGREVSRDLLAPLAGVVSAVAEHADKIEVGRVVSRRVTVGGLEPQLRRLCLDRLHSEPLECLPSQSRVRTCGVEPRLKQELPQPVCRRVHCHDSSPAANDNANLPGPLQELHAARNRNAAPVKFSDWFAPAPQFSLH
jgi:hypothetical protein